MPPCLGPSGNPEPARIPAPTFCPLLGSIGTPGVRGRRVLKREGKGSLGFFSFFLLKNKLFVVVFFNSNLCTRGGARTQNPQIRNPMLFRRSHSPPSLGFFKARLYRFSQVAFWETLPSPALPLFGPGVLCARMGARAGQNLRVKSRWAAREGPREQLTHRE